MFCSEADVEFTVLDSLLLRLAELLVGLFGGGANLTGYPEKKARHLVKVDC